MTIKQRIRDLINGVRKSEKVLLEERIQSLIDDGEEEGLIDEQSGDMIQSILELKETLAREVMIPRTEIVAVGSNATIGEIIDLIQKHGHTRMPVYEGDVDNIIGILNVKDLVRLWSHQITRDDLLSVIRPPYFIPEVKNVHSLLYEMKTGRIHLAIVIDEYGGTSGLVTLEDLLEEIVGDIQDEHDRDEQPFTELSGGDVLVDSRVEIEEFEEYFGLSAPEGKFETLGGLIFDLIKKIPVVGEVVTYGALTMVIEEADEKSIKSVRVRRQKERDSDSSKEGAATETEEGETVA